MCRAHRQHCHLRRASSTGSKRFAVSPALTLAFSAKESLYKAFSHRALPLPGFASAVITHIDPRCLTLRFLAEFSPQLVDQQATVYWQAGHTNVVTLAVG
ncbi:hypothetical protein CWS02_19495 [Enterobacter sp. EA-1]|nr:hypothetical protein CWS02_19495 [Enterobacter sp. EA-1]